MSPAFDPVAEAAQRGLFRPDDRGAAQRAVLTFLAYVQDADSAPTPSSKIVSVLEHAGISAVRSRAALSRMQRDGMLEVVRAGRTTAYRVDPERAEFAAPGVRRILSFGKQETWAKTWCLVAFSIPEEQKETRHLLRSRLQWLGYAPLYDGLWISPSGDPEPARRDLELLRVDSATVFVVDDARLFNRGRVPLDAWNLEPIRDQYLAFIAYCEEVTAALAREQPSAEAARSIALILTDVFRRFPQRDPAVPLDLMPPGWPRAAAREAYMAAMSACGEQDSTRSVRDRHLGSR